MIAYKPTTQNGAATQRAADQAILTQATRAAMLQQKRVDATSVLPDPSQATDDVLQAAFRIMQEATVPANNMPSDVTCVDTDDDVEHLNQVHFTDTFVDNSEAKADTTHLNASMPLFQAAISTHTQA